MAHVRDRYNAYKKKENEEKENWRTVAEEINGWVNFEASRFESVVGKIENVTIIYDVQTPDAPEWMKWLVPGGYRVNWEKGDHAERLVAQSNLQETKWVSTLSGD